MMPGVPTWSRTSSTAAVFLARVRHSSTARVRLGRAKPVTRSLGASRPSWVAMSPRTASVAVAVKAAAGTPRERRKAPSRR